MAVKTRNMAQAEFANIAQATWPVLHIGFQVEYRTSELAVPCAGQLSQPFDDLLRLARQQLRNHVVAQPREDSVITRKIPAIKQRYCEFGIRSFESAAFGERACGRAEFQPQIPEVL